jgi:hypothetical protein
VETGERTPIVTGLLRGLGLSPDSRYFLYMKDKQVWSYDLTANKNVNISAKAPVSFVNAEDDHAGEKPAYGVTGYTKDGKYVLLDHRYDIWVVSLDGTAAPRMLTDGVGGKSAMRLRYVSLDPDGPPAGFAGGGGGGRGGRGGGAGDMIDISKPMLFTAYGDLTKKSGFYELADGKVREIVYQDKRFGPVQKATNADRYLFTREDWSEFPDLQVSTRSFQNSKKADRREPAASGVSVGSTYPLRLRGQRRAQATRHSRDS